MRLYIPDMDEFFSFMHLNNYKYVILRNHEDFINRYPKKGSKEDVDILIEHKSIDVIYNRYKNVIKQLGVKCDIYSNKKNEKTDYISNPYLPTELANNLLNNRILFNNKFYISEDLYYFLSLIYHIIYQKHDTSKIPFYRKEELVKSKYDYYLDYLSSKLKIKKPECLHDMHLILKDYKYNISINVLRDYIIHDYHRINNNHQRRSYTYMYLQNESLGEMNLFVIRTSAINNKYFKKILKEIRSRFLILKVKKIDFLTRFITRKKMRGGKWRWGGYPCIAVVVFDRNPIPTTIEDMNVHPMVLNKNQFFKRNLREEFTNNYNVHKKANPIHSTDNESEAIGHLDLYFDNKEIESIFNKVDFLRENY